MKINDTVKWVGAIIVISTFFFGVIIAMSRATAEDIKKAGVENGKEIEANKEEIMELKINQTKLETEIHTKLSNIEDDVKEIKEILKAERTK